MISIVSSKQEVNVDAYYNEIEDEYLFGNATVVCPKCQCNNMPFRKKKKPVGLSKYLQHCNSTYLGFDLCSYWKTSCSRCKTEYRFRLLYQQ